MASDLTGARLVEAAARRLWDMASAANGEEHGDPWGPWDAPTTTFAEGEEEFFKEGFAEQARGALCAQAEAAGVTAEDMIDLAECLDGNWSDSAQRVAALLRALAEVLRDDR